jgi:CheY-like chemotaxis protein
MAKPKVLVVNDEPGVTGLVALALWTLGYEVHAVPSRVQALKPADAMPCFDLLVSDVSTPQMCGPDLVRHIAQTCPTIAIVMMSATTISRNFPVGWDS